MDNELKALLRELLSSRPAAGPVPESPAALAAAKREFDTDPNRLDPRHVQDRMDNAAHDLRVRMGLERA